MASLDVDLLFINIPLDETICIVIEIIFFFENETVHNFSKDQFKCLLTLSKKEAYLLFDGELYQNVDRLLIGSSLGPTLANNFYWYYEDIWLCNYSLECKPSYFKRYVGDIFVLFEAETQVESFKDFVNTCYPKMKLTFEKNRTSISIFLMLKLSKKKFFLLTEFNTVNLLLLVFIRIFIITCH